MSMTIDWDKPECLVVEDIDDWFDQIHKVLLETCPNAKPPIRRAKSVEGYIAMQRQATFAVTILDIRLALSEREDEKTDQDTHAGLDICPQIPLWNPDAVVILFSAYVNIDEAVVAMRHGAWDCINKVEALDPIERLRQGITTGINCRTGRDAWFAANVGRLREEYGGQHIAVVEGEVVASGFGLLGVKEQVRARDPMLAAKFYLVPTKRPGQ
jgi:Response regulator containing CheY-like receiver, AAA-type ATPase, and DNA-binding domains